jgi:hypothetical protein
MVVSAARFIKERGVHATLISEVLEYSWRAWGGGVIVTAVTTRLAWAQAETTERSSRFA